MKQTSGDIAQANTQDLAQQIRALQVRVARLENLGKKGKK